MRTLFERVPFRFAGYGTVILYPPALMMAELRLEHCSGLVRNLRIARLGQNAFGVFLPHTEIGFKFAHILSPVLISLLKIRRAQPPVPFGTNWSEGRSASEVVTKDRH